MKAGAPSSFQECAGALGAVIAEHVSRVRGGCEGDSSRVCPTRPHVAVNHHGERCQRVLSALAAVRQSRRPSRIGVPPESALAVGRSNRGEPVESERCNEQQSGPRTPCLAIAHLPDGDAAPNARIGWSEWRGTRSSQSSWRAASTSLGHFKCVDWTCNPQVMARPTRQDLSVACNQPAQFTIGG